jgi:hypothetical protein
MSGRQRHGNRRGIRDLPKQGNATMGIGTILLVVLVLALLGVIPAWPHSRSWGYAPSGGISLVVVILLVLLLSGRI